MLYWKEWEIPRSHSRHKVIHIIACKGTVIPTMSTTAITQITTAQRDVIIRGTHRYWWYSLDFLVRGVHEDSKDV